VTHLLGRRAKIGEIGAFQPLAFDSTKPELSQIYAERNLILFFKQEDLRGRVLFRSQKGPDLFSRKKKLLNRRSGVQAVDRFDVPLESFYPQ